MVVAAPRLAQATAAGRTSGLHASPAWMATAGRPRSRRTTLPSCTATRVVRAPSALTVNVVPVSSSSPSGKHDSTTRRPGADA